MNNNGKEMVNITTISAESEIAYEKINKEKKRI